nr:MAG TPA: hypothetical protein [Caudoviricetes sp.]
MSRKFEKVKYYYEKRLWTKEQVANAVKKGWITADEYRDITGEDYSK